jgi:hypothetical protein
MPTVDVWRGALKSAISSASALLLSLPVLDPEHFNITTLGGWTHLGGIIGWTIVIGEARFWKAWADGSDHSHTTAP